jgi:hypothetical protein
MRASCECGCGRTFERAETGRPRKFYNDACKERAKRKRRKAEDRNAVARVKEIRVDESGEAAICHICNQRPATRGFPVPLICATCGDAGVRA